MATLPTIPSFVTNEVPTLAKMQQLANAVSFVTQIPIVISLKKSASQSLTASTDTAVTWDVSEVDTDTMHSTTTNPSRLVAQTQGYYKLHATLPMPGTATAANFKAWFLQTTGANNPLGSGHTQMFGANFQYSDGTAGDTMSLHISSITPCLYVNDYVEVYVNAGVASSVGNAFFQTSNNDAAGNKDGAACLYGVYAFKGP